MNRCVLLLMALCLASQDSRAELHALVVQGVGGNEEWAERFAAQAAGIFERLSDSGARATLLSGSAVNHASLQAQFARLHGELGPGDRFAAILVGHGSYDGEIYKFNIPGPDVTGRELLDWIGALPAKARLLVNASSASGALQEASRDDLLLVTGTRNGREKQAPRFGGHFLTALDQTAADLDKNRSISVAEAFAYAQRAVADHFESDQRLATAHPQLSGPGADGFELTRLGAGRAQARDAAPSDPRRAELTARRDELDRQIADLRARRQTLESADYLAQLQNLLVALALVSRQIEALE